MALLALSAAGCQGAPPSQNSQPTEKTPTLARTKPALAKLANEAGGYVSSFDDDGVPQFIWAVDQKGSPEANTPMAAAEYHLRRFAPALDMRPSDLMTAEVRFIRDMGEGGHLAEWRQRINGVEVYPSEVSVLMNKNLELVAVSGRLRRPTPETREFEMSAEGALALALSAHVDAPVSPADLVELDGSTPEGRRYRSGAGAPVLMSNSRTKPIFYAHGKSMTPAWFVEFYVAAPSAVEIGALDSAAFRYIVSAVDGRIFDVRSLTANEAITFRVWADPNTGRPFEGPTVDVTPHPTGAPNGFVPAIIPPNLVTIDAFNRFRDTWLPLGAVETRGNNVDAYTDHDLPNHYTNGDLRATITAPLTFDRTFDVALDPIASEDQSMASVAELFYVNNWLHDWWYDSGFDEAAGNAQAENFGRGGEGGDVLLAEAQDNVLRGNRNNANMSTPSDGMSPTMQMYSWTGAETVTLTFTPGGVRDAGTAAFGARNFNITGQLIAGNPVNGCTAITNNVAGRIVLVDRGACNFTLKALNAQNAGAIGVIVANNAPNPVPPGLGGADPAVTIGTLSVTQDAGIAIRADLANGPVSVTMFRNVDVDRDGSLDQQVVAHEWGHYFHHRLSDCGTSQCGAMSEGWGDWNSIFIQLEEGEDLNGAYPSGVYATRSFDADSSFFGIRRVAYSASMEVNALTFRCISDDETLPTTAPISPGGQNSEVHNAGEVWSTMLFTAYVDLIRARTSSATPSTFEEVQRLMGDYVVAGLLMTPRDATFTEVRDSILAAAYARSPADMVVMATAFAGRGFGSCAVSPPRGSDDFRGVVEGFDLRPRVALTGVSFDESVRSCDDDGVLDADEIGLVHLSVGNAGAMALSGARVTLTSTSAGVSFPAGASFLIPDLAPFSSTNVELQIGLDSSLTAPGSLVLAVGLDALDSCETTLTSTVYARVNYDEVGGARNDDVESNGSPWTPDGDLSTDAWARTQVAAFDFAWVGSDLGTTSDTSLISPTLNVGTSTTDDFIVSFQHRYDFEFGGGLAFDGAVIEISGDDGVTWEDVSVYVDPGYQGTMTDTSGNPLGLRDGYVGTSTAWPARQRVTLNFGGDFAGDAVRVRFRIGTDVGVGAFGWEIDNLTFENITNAPFEQLGNNVGVCPSALTANAGPDQTVDPGVIVFLEGSGMSFQNLPLTFAWTQTVGPTVNLTRADTATPLFTATSLEPETVLTFELAISDGTRTATDTVDITVRGTTPAVVTADAGEDSSANVNELVLLDGSGSNTTGAAPLTYAWAQTAGAAVTITNPTAAVARFTAPALEAGETLTFELTVSDGLHTATDTVDVAINSALLIADAGEDQIAKGGDNVVLDGSGSQSASGGTITFAWTQTAGPDVTVESADTAFARFTAPGVTTETVLTFQLSVGDGARTSVDTVNVTIGASSVTADAGEAQTVDAKAMVVLDGTGSRGTALTYAWSQKAGPAVQLKNADGVAASFTAGAPESAVMLTFELTVTDESGATDTDSVVVTVRAVEDEGCGCSTTHTGESSSALAMLGLAGLAMFLRRRRIKG